MYPKCFCGQGSTLNPAARDHGALPYLLAGFVGPLRSRDGREGE